MILSAFSIYKVFSENSRPLNILTDYLDQSDVKILITEAATMMTMMYKLKSKSTEMPIECFVSLLPSP